MIEDYITIQPKSTESVHQPLDQSLFKQMSASIDLDKQGMVSIEDKAALAITNDPNKDLSI